MSVTGWLALAWTALGGIAAGMMLAYWTRARWYPRVVARQMLRRRQP